MGSRWNQQAEKLNLFLFFYYHFIIFPCSHSYWSENSKHVIYYSKILIFFVNIFHNLLRLTNQFFFVKFLPRRASLNQCSFS